MPINNYEQSNTIRACINSGIYWQGIKSGELANFRKTSN